MILAIIAAWMAYKKAKATNRNAILWAFIAAATFIGTQLIVTLGFGVLLGFGVGIFGWSESAFDTYNIPITIIAIIASFISTWMVLRYLDRVPEEPTFISPPQPPTDFEQKN